MRRPARGFCIGRHTQDASKVAYQFDLEFAIFWRKDDPLDQRAQDLAGMKPLLLRFFLQGCVELTNLLPIVVGHVGMKQRGWSLGRGKCLNQVRFARLPCE
ncbi:hypothetical protein [Reyranella sp.]|uniref:hypothetical protein n=1 Tax=Reyranella sp. TaxID=1929291 RepID=UPI003523F882